MAHESRVIAVSFVNLECTKFKDRITKLSVNRIFLVKSDHSLFCLTKMVLAGQVSF